MCTTSLEYPRHSMRAKSSHCATPHNVSVLFPERTPNSWPPPRLPPLRSSLTCRSPPAPAGAASLALLRTPPCLCSKNHAAGEGERAGCVGPGRWQRCRTPPAPWKCCQRTRPPPPPPSPPPAGPPPAGPPRLHLVQQARQRGGRPRNVSEVEGVAARGRGKACRRGSTVAVYGRGAVRQRRDAGSPAPGRRPCSSTGCSPSMLQSAPTSAPLPNAHPGNSTKL